MFCFVFVYIHIFIHIISLIHTPYIPILSSRSLYEPLVIRPICAVSASPEPAEPGLGACEESEEEAAHEAFQGDLGDLGGATAWRRKRGMSGHGDPRENFGLWGYIYI